MKDTPETEAEIFQKHYDDYKKQFANSGRSCTPEDEKHWREWARSNAAYTLKQRQEAEAETYEV
ncbi:MAG: hypothetical protein HC936_04685 [Leptolyngbyaceae cyanobacterium SU_3_3]|nr:hypothetical protein [Leptolyngbyaceae cyanobacterium SU_3_3]